jgi:hypothetical protein
MIKFINANTMADCEEEDVIEIKELLEQGLIKRLEHNQPVFMVLEENFETVKEKLNKPEYSTNYYFEYLSPFELLKYFYGGAGYDIEVSYNFSSVGMEVDEAVEYIEDEKEFFTNEVIEELYNAEDPYKCYRNILEQMTKKALKLKMLKMIDMIDSKKLWND